MVRGFWRRPGLSWLDRPQMRLGLVAIVIFWWGFSTVSALAPNHRPQRRDAPAYHALVPDCSRVACLALTFDDGPNRATTSRVLDTLEKERIPATFFVIGSRVQPNADLIQRMYKDGHEIGNHSWSHPDMTTLKPAQIRQQIVSTQRAIERVSVPAPTLFRPPYGAANAVMHKNIPLTFMFWNEDPRDWEAHRSSEVARAIEVSARPGGVVDMHDIYGITAAALPEVIHNLKSRHYHFVTVSQLLDLHPGQKGDFYGHLPPKGRIP